MDAYRNDFTLNRADVFVNVSYCSRSSVTRDACPIFVNISYCSKSSVAGDACAVICSSCYFRSHGERVLSTDFVITLRIIMRPCNPALFHRFIFIAAALR